MPLAGEFKLEGQDAITEEHNMSTYRLEEMAWTELDQLDRERSLVWIPISPIEAHGPHLPLGTDLFGARDMAEMAAEMLTERDEALQNILVPPIPLGGCRITADFPGTISIRGTTLAQVVVDVCTSLADHGFRYMVIANHHLDPVHMKAIFKALDDLNAHHPHLRIIEVLSRVVFSGMETEAKRLGEEMGLDMAREIHADVCETAYIRYRYPELYKRPPEPLRPVSIDVKAEMLKGVPTFKQMGAQLGYLGSPEAATESFGKICLEEKARLAADLAHKLVHGAPLPEVPPKVKAFFDHHVQLD
jgi:creatinine amidohydrolase